MERLDPSRFRGTGVSPVISIRGGMPVPLQLAAWEGEAGTVVEPAGVRAAASGLIVRSGTRERFVPRRRMPPTHRRANLNYAAQRRARFAQTTPGVAEPGSGGERRVRPFEQTRRLGKQPASSSKQTTSGGEQRASGAAQTRSGREQTMSGREQITSRLNGTAPLLRRTASRGEQSAS